MTEEVTTMSMSERFLELELLRARMEAQARHEARLALLVRAGDEHIARLEAHIAELEANLSAKDGVLCAGTAAA